MKFTDNGLSAEKYWWTSEFTEGGGTSNTTSTYILSPYYEDITFHQAKKDPPCKHNWRNKWKNPKKREQYCTKCPATRL